MYIFKILFIRSFVFPKIFTQLLLFLESRSYVHAFLNRICPAFKFENFPLYSCHSRFPGFIFSLYKTLSTSSELFSCMKIQDLDDVFADTSESSDAGKAVVDAKRVLVGAGARILFYPTLLYNVFRNRIQPEFRWWDEIDQFLLLGAVPFPKDVPKLKLLGVGGVITLNESYETLVPTELYKAHEIDHLVIPTRDYLFAPSFVDINCAVEFIHRNASCGKTTYVHCKAGRGRSTTVVLCYLVEYKHMTPVAALEYVRSRRPRVLLAPSQWKAVQEYRQHRLASTAQSPSRDAVIITKADLEGYHSFCDADAQKKLAIVTRATRSSPVIARLSCLFSSLKVSGDYTTITRQLTEAHAC